jgi:NADH:ubiquinone oxidoreductase subunit 3 (subunit A)
MLSYIITITFIVILLIYINFIFIKTNVYSDAKLSPYECGMNPLGDARHKFRIDYILIGILFIIFDLEIVFLFPYLIFNSSILAY